MEARTVHVEFAQAVESGLRAFPRSIPSVWHYDALGSALFEAICLLPEYDLTRIENSVITRNATEIVQSVGTLTEIVELGSGVAAKTVALISAATRRNASVCYRPIDVSAAALHDAERRLDAACPGVAFAPIIGDYTELLTRGLPHSSGTRLVLFLGSNIGNYSPGQAKALLDVLRRALEPGDAFLLGAALQRPDQEIVDAYDDPTGVTAAFNKNVLGRINRELGGDFDVRAFNHEVEYDSASGALDSFLVSQSRQSVRIDALQQTFDFSLGERIHTESSHKYTLEGVRRLGEDAGFRWVKNWSDSQQRFCDALFIAD
jgi:L-histidine N-alpha-methyltransferase